MVLVVLVVAGKAPPSGAPASIRPSVYCCFFVVFVFLAVLFFILLVLAVAGKAPWGTPCHQILVVFDGFGGFWLFCSAVRGFSCCW